MNVSYIILIYTIICIAMIAFNTLAILASKGSVKINVIKEEKYRNLIKEQFKNIEEKENVSEEHLNYLKKVLRNSNNLLTYDLILSTYIKRKDENIEYINTYLDAVRPVFEELLYKYEKKNNIEKAFFIKLLHEYRILKENSVPAIDDIMFENLNDESIYCRDNAYIAICSMDDEEKINEALKLISNSKKFYHENIITIGLNTYNGNTKKLLDLLFKNFYKYQTEVKCSIIDFASLSNTQYNNFILDLLLQKNVSKKIKISCLKYFEYIYYKSAESVITTYAEIHLNKDIDLCYQSIKSLRNYKSKKSINTIEKAIYSNNFKIRDIACESLAFIRLGLSSKEQDTFLNNEELLDLYNYHYTKNEKKSGDTE